MAGGAQAIAVAAEIGGAAGLTVLIAMTVAHYRAVPDRVPVHFGLLGQPDAWAGRWALWIAVAIGALAFAGMTALNLALANGTLLGATSTAGVAAVLPTFLIAEVIWLTAALQWSIIRTAVGAAHGLGIEVIAAIAGIAATAIGIAAIAGSAQR